MANINHKLYFNVKPALCDSDTFMSLCGLGVKEWWDFQEAQLSQENFFAVPSDTFSFLTVKNWFCVIMLKRRINSAALLKQNK